MKMTSAERKNYRASSKSWLSAAKFIEKRKTPALAPTNCDLYHYAGNNPVKYTDPDGKETYDSGITKEQYNDSWLLQKSMSWDDVQNYFNDNPNGVLHRPDDQFSFMKLDSKKEIVDPNACNTALVGIVLGLRISSRAFNYLKNIFPNKIPEGRWQIERSNGTKAEIHSGHTHFDKATGKDEPLHTHEILPRNPRDPKAKTEPFYKDKNAHKTTRDEIKLYKEQYQSGK